MDDRKADYQEETPVDRGDELDGRIRVCGEDARCSSVGDYLYRLADARSIRDGRYQRQRAERRREMEHERGDQKAGHPEDDEAAQVDASGRRHDAFVPRHARGRERELAADVDERDRDGEGQARRLVARRDAVGEEAPRPDQHLHPRAQQPARAALAAAARILDPLCHDRRFGGWRY